MRIHERRVSIVWLTGLLLALSPLAPARGQTDLAHHDRWVTSLAFSGDGGLLFTGGGESLQYRPGDIKVWDTKSGKLSQSLDGSTANVWGLALSPDGKLLLAAQYDGKAVLWDVAAKKPRNTLEKHKGWVRAAAVSGDGAHFAAAGEDGQVVVWSAADGKEEKSFAAHAAAVYGLAFSPDGKSLATASVDKNVKFWDWAAGKETGKLPEQADAVWCVAWTKDGGHIIAGAERKLKLFNPQHQEQAALEGHKDWITGLAVSTDGKWAATTGLDRSVKFWNLAEKKEDSAWLPKLTASAWAAAFSADGKLLAVGCHNGARLLDLAARKELYPPPPPADEPKPAATESPKKEEPKKEEPKK